MESSSHMLWSLLLGGFGIGFFIYGKRQKAVVPLVVGLALFVVPYFIANVGLLLAVGALLVALPYFVRL